MITITTSTKFEYTYAPKVDINVYSATFYLSGASIFNATGTVENGLYKFTFGATSTANFTAGFYDYQIILQHNTDAEDIIVGETGQAEVVQRADLAPAGDRITHAQKVLNQIEELLENRTLTDQNSYTINGRNLTRMTIEELLKLRGYYRELVQQNAGCNTIQKLTFRTRTQ